MIVIVTSEWYWWKEVLEPQQQSSKISCWPWLHTQNAKRRRRRRLIAWLDQQECQLWLTTMTCLISRLSLKRYVHTLLKLLHYKAEQWGKARTVPTSSTRSTTSYGYRRCVGQSFWFSMPNEFSRAYEGYGSVQWVCYSQRLDDIPECLSVLISLYLNVKRTDQHDRGYGTRSRSVQCLKHLTYWLTIYSPIWRTRCLPSRAFLGVTVWNEEGRWCIWLSW